MVDGGLISLDVLVEYIDYCNKLTCHNVLCEHGCIETDIKLKVNPKDNSINIKLPSKDSFTKQEYEEGLRKAFQAGAMHYVTEGKIYGQSIDVDKFVEQILNPTI